MQKKFCLSALAAALGFVFLTSPSAAQIDANRAAPAEVPPASYTAIQYVDSRGCVYVRAGVDGAVRWVPRVSRSRKVVCGFKPSLSTGQRSAARAPQQQQRRDANVVQIVPRGAPASQPAPQVRTQAPAPRQVTQPRVTVSKPQTNARRAAPVATIASKPAPRRVAPAPVVRQQPVQVRRAPAVAQPRVVTRKVAPAPVAPAPSTASQTGCIAASEVSTPYMAKGPNVRCGAQVEPFVKIRGQKQLIRGQDGKVRNARTRGAEVYSGTSGVTHLSGNTVIAPRKAYEERRNTVVKVPQGYKPAWTDGRLNPKRGHMTADGRRRMLLKWTNTTPRRLVDSYTGEEVSRYFPDLRYPYTSRRQQRAAGQ